MYAQTKYGSTILHSTSLESFESELRNQGFETVIQRTWAPATTLDLHVLDIAAKALVVRGEMWWTMWHSI